MKSDHSSKITRVVAAVLETDGRILLTKRPIHVPRGGLWELPGGKVEDGESDDAALARELREELGIEVEVLDLLASVTHAYDDLCVQLVAYRCRLISGTPRPLGADAMEWVDIDALDDYDLPEADVPIIASLRQS